MTRKNVLSLSEYYSSPEFERKYFYKSDDMGAVWTASHTSFRVWAPGADRVWLNLYSSGDASVNDLIDRFEMFPDQNGTWLLRRAGNLNGVYYTFTVNRDGTDTEACDPYARTTGVNGRRAMVIDLRSTDPEDWDLDKDPNSGLSVTDRIIYEVHVRDISSDPSSGIQHTGRFSGVAETGTKTPSGIPTGLDHIKDLGINSIHLLPVFDYGSVDEARPDIPSYNWGYDPVNYNVPEGSYSSDPFNGAVRVKEMKQMIKALHDNGLSVIMDVVYNHVYRTDDFCINRLVPEYFSRVDRNGIFSNGSFCGNDTASERIMVRKYIIDSIAYWADEYHIDGFRFDLAGLIDTETINGAIKVVHKKHPDVIFYGEGWTMSTDMVKPDYLLTTQLNAPRTPEFAFFNDTLRDALRGSVFEDHGRGYVSGAPGFDNVIMECFSGQARPWCSTPLQTVNYASCHDNLSLIDRLSVSIPESSFEERVAMNRLAAAIYITSQGIVFMQAGEEMLRSKVNADGGLVENSYCSPDSVNGIKWSTLDDPVYMDTFQYYKGLLSFRRMHPVLRLTSAKAVCSHIEFAEHLEKNVTAFLLHGDIKGEPADRIFIIFNPNRTRTKVRLPEGIWKVCVNGDTAGTAAIDTINDDCVCVNPISAMILIQ